MLAFPQYLQFPERNKHPFFPTLTWFWEARQIWNMKGKSRICSAFFWMSRMTRLCWWFWFWNESKSLDIIHGYTAKTPYNCSNSIFCWLCSVSSLGRLGNTGTAPRRTPSSSWKRARFLPIYKYSSNGMMLTDYCNVLRVLVTGEPGSCGVQPPSFRLCPI